MLFAQAMRRGTMDARPVASTHPLNDEDSHHRGNSDGRQTLQLIKVTLNPKSVPSKEQSLIIDFQLDHPKP